MLRKQVKKYGLALGLGISMLLLAGCEKKSVDDLYNILYTYIDINARFYYFPLRLSRNFMTQQGIL